MRTGSRCARRPRSSTLSSPRHEVPSPAAGTPQSWRHWCEPIHTHIHVPFRCSPACLVPAALIVLLHLNSSQQPPSTRHGPCMTPHHVVVYNKVTARRKLSCCTQGPTSSSERVLACQPHGVPYVQLCCTCRLAHAVQAYCRSALRDDLTS
eukprot:COSAG02_NODE_706_length_18259_cov_10.340253_16_plen_151_part_00